MKPKAINFTVAVTDEVKSTTTQSGIFIPSSSQEKPRIATVFSIGENVKTLKPGDIVAYKPGRGTEIKSEDKTYRMLEYSDILCIMKD